MEKISQMSPSKFHPQSFCPSIRFIADFPLCTQRWSAPHKAPQVPKFISSDLASVHDQYYDPDFNGKDINAWEHKFDGNSPHKRKHSKRSNQLLAELGDPYTRYLDSEETQKKKI